MPHPKNDDKSRKRSYHELRGFGKVSIGEMKDYLKICWRNGLVPMVVGPAGIGKTSIVNSAAEECEVEWTNPKTNETRKDPYTVLPMFLSQKAPEDISGIPIPNFETQTVSMLRPEELPKASDPPTVILLDEINQADHTVQRTVFQLLGERKLGTYELAPHHALAAAANPDGTNYQTTRPTPALMRRLVWTEAEFEVMSWLKWAENEGNIHPSVISYIKSNPDHILNQEALDNDKIFANPASWEKVSNVVKNLSNESLLIYNQVFAGLVGSDYAKSFYKHLVDFSKDIKATDVLDQYSNIRRRVQKAAKDGRVDILTQLTNSLVVECTTIDPNTPEFKAKSDNVASFFSDLPSDVAVEFARKMEEVFTAARKSDVYMKWIEILFSHPESSKITNEILSYMTKQAGDDDDD